MTHLRCLYVMFSVLSLCLVLSPMRRFLDWRLVSPEHGQWTAQMLGVSRRQFAQSSIAGTLGNTQ